MTKGLQAYGRKQRREIRRRNRIARDLAEPKYKQRVVEDKRHKALNHWSAEEVYSNLYGNEDE